MNVKKMFVIFALLATSVAQAADPKAAVDTLKGMLSKHGAPKAEGTTLSYGSVKINDRNDEVDAVKEKAGSNCTVFVKSGDEFTRIATNIMKDGKRAVGTNLDHNKAYDTVMKGETYTGDAKILGADYNACYEPIKDAGGKVAGILLCAYKK